MSITQTIILVFTATVFFMSLPTTSSTFLLWRQAHKEGDGLLGFTRALFFQALSSTLTHAFWFTVFILPVATGSPLTANLPVLYLLLIIYIVLGLNDVGSFRRIMQESEIRKEIEHEHGTKE